MAVVISGNGIDMGNNPVSNASQVDGTVINENGDNVATTSNLVGFKNYIINGNFDIWQRGNGPFTNYNYGADRWIVYNGTAIMTSSTTMSDGIQKRIAHIQNVTAGEAFLAQAIELPLTGFGHPFVVGKKFTVSVRYSSSTKIRPLLIFRDSGAGVNPVELDSQMNSLVYKGGSGVDETVSWTFTVDGTAASTNTCLVLALVSESNASHVFMYQVQLEEGSVATPFEQRPYGLELSLCQRYYCHVNVTPTGDSVWLYTFLPVPMRVLPTLTLVSGGLNGATYVVVSHSCIRQNSASTSAIDGTLACTAEI